MAKFAEQTDDSDIIQKIIPHLNSLAKDTNQHVRAALAESICQLSPLIGKKPTNDHVLQIFLLLLRDESSDVRVNLFKYLDAITKVIDLDSLSQSLLPALNDLAVDKNWRTRTSAVEFLGFFAKKMVSRFLIGLREKERVSSIIKPSLDLKIGVLSVNWWTFVTYIYLYSNTLTSFRVQTSLMINSLKSWLIGFLTESMVLGK